MGVLDHSIQSLVGVRKVGLLEQTAVVLVLEVDRGYLEGESEEIVEGRMEMERERG